MLLPSQIQLTRITTGVFNTLSIIASLVVIILYIVARSKYPHLVNRVSLRLTVAASTADLIYSGFQILNTSISYSTSLCRFSAWGYLFFSLLPSLFVFSLALNLQLVVLHGKRNTANLEKWYYAVPIFISLSSSFIALFGGFFTWPSASNDTCWFIEAAFHESSYWQWILLHSWILISAVYGLIIVVAVSIYLWREKRSLDASIRWDANHSDSSTILDIRQTYRRLKRQQELSFTIRRILLYPLVPIVSQFFHLTSDIIVLVQNGTIFWVLFIGMAGASLQGFLNACAFSVDPAMTAMRKQIRKRGFETGTLDDPENGSFDSKPLSASTAVIMVDDSDNTITNPPHKQALRSYISVPKLKEFTAGLKNNIKVGNRPNLRTSLSVPENLNAEQLGIYEPRASNTWDWIYQLDGNLSVSENREIMALNQIREQL